jgi:CRISPR-associated protein Cmr2
MKMSNWLLIFTFSPVQGFISSAKKTKDLYAGSYLLSFLTKRVLKTLEEQQRESLEIIFPIVKEKSENSDCDEIIWNHYVGNYPNRFVVLLKNKTPDEVKKIIEETKGKFNKEISKISEETCQYFVEKVLENADKCPEKLNNLNNLRKAVEQITSHIGDYFQTFIVAKPVNYSDGKVENYQQEYELTEKILGGRKTFRPYKGKVDKTTYEIKDERGNTKSLYPDGCTTCGERLHIAIDWRTAKVQSVAEEEKLCGLCFAKRNLYKVYLADAIDLPKKCEEFKKEIELLMERFPSTHDIALAKEKFKFFKALKETYEDKDGKLLKFSQIADDITFFIWDIAGIKHSFKEDGAKSYGINRKYRQTIEEFLKDLIPNEKYLEDYERKRKSSFVKTEEAKYSWMLSVEYLSTDYLKRKLKELEIKENKTEEDERKIKILKEWIKYLKNYFEALKEINPEWNFEKEFNKPPYFAILYSDGDYIGKILGGDKEFINRPFDLEFHKEFSEKLSEYALATAKEIEEPKRENSESVGFAKVIYAGGDDIFAFLHLSEVIRALKLTSENYKEKLKGLLKEGKATTSAGVVLGHAKVSLKYLHKKTKEAESRAKNLFGRNAFVIKVISRSGEETEFGAKYEYECPHKVFKPLELLEDLTKLYSEGGISSKLPYTLRDIADRFLPLAEGVEKEVARRLLKRELERKINLSNKEKKKEIIDKVLELFEYQLIKHVEDQKQLTVKEILKNLAGMFYVARKLSEFYSSKEPKEE